MTASLAVAILMAVVGGTGVAAPVGASGSVLENPVGADPASTTIRLGPFQLAGASGAGVDRLLHERVVVVPKPCEDCFVTGFLPRVVDRAGARADMETGVMLHHIAIFDSGKLRPECGIGSASPGEPVFGSGDERAPIILPTGFGLKVEPGLWVGLVHLMNESEAAREVYVEIDVNHVPAAMSDLKAATLLVLGINTCRGDPTYAAGRGRSARTASWTSSLTGRIIAAFGHVHPGGIGTILTNVSTGERQCASEASYGVGVMSGMVTGMSPCSWDRLGTVKAGQQLAVTSLYHTPRPLSRAMGIMLVVVYETQNLAGGTAAPARFRQTPDTAVPDSVRDHDLSTHHSGHGPPGL